MASVSKEYRSFVFFIYTCTRLGLYHNLGSKWHYIYLGDMVYQIMQETNRDL